MAAFDPLQTFAVPAFDSFAGMLAWQGLEPRSSAGGHEWRLDPYGLFFP